MENNTTVADCVADCVEAASSSIFDDIEMVLVAGGALLGLAAWAFKKYKTMMADGEITLDELLDAAKEGKEKLEEVEDDIAVIERVYSEYKVAELKELLAVMKKSKSSYWNRGSLLKAASEEEE